MRRAPSSRPSSRSCARRWRRFDERAGRRGTARRPPSCRGRPGSRAARTRRACRTRRASSLQAATFAHACGVWSNSLKQTVSTMPQLSKSRHQRSICAGVTRAGLVDEGGEHPRLVPARLPQRLRQRVVAASLRDLLDVRHRDAEGLRRADAEAHQVVDVLLRAHLLERRKRVLDLIGHGARGGDRFGWRVWCVVSASGAAACGAV